MKIRVALPFLALVAGCAALPADEAEILIDHAPAGISVSMDRTGVLFGSVGFVPRDLSVSALSFHLRSVDGKGHRFEVYATNQKQHVNWRTPDVDTDAQRLWVFSGRVPAGRYEIALAGVSGADPRKVNWVNFKPAIPVTVAADGAVYVGRWQFSPAAAQEDGPQFTIGKTGLVLKDTPEEDQALLARRRGISPIGNRMIDDALRDLLDQGKI